MARAVPGARGPRGEAGAGTEPPGGPSDADPSGAATLSDVDGSPRAEASPGAASPFRPVDAAALALVRDLARETLGALATLDPTGHPAVSRVAVIVRGGAPVVLASDLSHHTRAMRADPRVSLLLGTPPSRGDPLAHPRVTAFGEASMVERGDEHGALRGAWLAAHPKAALYVDFADFHFWRIAVTRASLNGGFGRAHELTGEEWARGAVG